MMKLVVLEGPSRKGMVTVAVPMEGTSCLDAEIMEGVAAVLISCARPFWYAWLKTVCVMTLVVDPVSTSVGV